MNDSDQIMADLAALLTDPTPKNAEMVCRRVREYTVKYHNSVRHSPIMLRKFFQTFVEAHEIIETCRGCACSMSKCECAEIEEQQRLGRETDPRAVIDLDEEE